MKKKPTISARLRYEFDKTMAAGAIALVGWLALISLVTIIFAGAVLSITQIAPEGSEPLSFLEGFWASLMRTLDAGTMGGDTGWGYRLIMLLVTLAGIVTLVSPEQSWNAQAPMLVTPDGMPTPDSRRQPWNAPSPMVVTLAGMAYAPPMPPGY